jgi:ABC-type sugar transport system ATPase subunit
VLRGLYGLGGTRDGRTPANPRAAVRQGVAYVPEHRVEEAFFTGDSVTANIVAARQPSYWRGMMRNAAQRRDAERAAAQCRVRAPALSAPISSLSGGNQQKAVLARWLLTRPRLLLLDEPTQGVDVAGRLQIHELIRERAAAGTAVLLTSSDFDETAELCDRVIVLARGQVVAELRGAEVTAERTARLAQWTAAAPSRSAS